MFCSGIGAQIMNKRNSRNVRRTQRGSTPIRKKNYDSNKGLGGDRIEVVIMKKENLTEEQMIFQDAVRTFFERESKPHHEQWEKDGIVSRDIWKKAGENNFFVDVILSCIAPISVANVG